MTELLTPPAFVWCIAGPHINESLAEIVDRKSRDVERFGWCLWAYGGTGNAHPETEVRRLAEDHSGGGALPLLMPDRGKKWPEVGVPFTGYRKSRDGEIVTLPRGMTPVTGGRTSWAFWITSLEWSEAAKVDVSQYVAPYSRSGPRRLPEYLRGSHGRACAARAEMVAPPDERGIHVVAELRDPFAVFLAR